MSIMNTECAVRETGFFGCAPGACGPTGQRQQQALEGVFCLSTVETASFWHYSSAQRIGYFPSIRSGVSADYLVTCWHEDSGVFLLAGNNEGGGIVCEVNPSSVAVVGALTAEGGHTDTIRCATAIVEHGPDGHSRRFLLSGGEDGRLCMWKNDSEAAELTATSSTSAGYSSSSRSSGGIPRIARSGGGATTHRNRSKNIRYAPY